MVQRAIYASYWQPALNYVLLLKLTFIYDESGRRGQHLSALIDYAMSTQDADQKSDTEVADNNGH